MANTHASTTALETTSASETHTLHVQEENEPASEDAITHDEPTEVTAAKASTVTRPATKADPDDEAETPVAEATDPSDNVNPPASDALERSESEEEEDGSSAGDSDSDSDADSASQSGDNIDEVTQRIRGLGVSHSTYAQFTDGHIETGPGWNGRWYTSRSGNVFDTAKPPPEKCFNCDGDHWRKDCPNGRRY